MKTTIRYILLTALRDKLFLVLFGAVVLASGISTSLSGTALIEEHQMTLAFASATARIILVVGLIVFASFHIRHAFDSKEIDVMLSRPISRANLVLSYWLGLALISLIMSVSAIGVVWFLSPISMSGFLHWSLSLIFELWLVSAIALFCALILKSAAVSVLSSLCLYTFARMMGFFLATVQSRSLFRIEWLDDLGREFMNHIAILVPRLDFFAQGDWLIYGLTESTQSILLYTGQTLIFIPILLLVATIDFNKRQF